MQSYRGKAEEGRDGENGQHPSNCIQRGLSHPTCNNY